MGQAQHIFTFLDCEWGDWLLWNFDSAAPRQNGGRGGGRGMGERRGRMGGGRGGWGRGGVGRGNGAAFTSEEVSDMELSSQDVRNERDPEIRGVRKRLVNEDGSVALNGKVVVPPGTVAGKVLQIEAAPNTSTSTGTPGKQPIVKRRCQGEGAYGQDEMEILNEATSLADGVGNMP